MTLYLLLAFGVNMVLPGVREPLARVEGVTTTPKLFAYNPSAELARCFVI